MTGCLRVTNLAMYALAVLFAIGWIIWALSPMAAIDQNGRVPLVNEIINRFLGLTVGLFLEAILIYVAVIMGRINGGGPYRRRDAAPDPSPEPGGDDRYGETGFTPVDHPAIGHALYHNSQEGRQRYSERHNETEIGRRGDEFGRGVRLPDVPEWERVK